MGELSGPALGFLGIFENWFKLLALVAAVLFAGYLVYSYL